MAADEPTTGLTLRGTRSAVEQFIRDSTSGAHTWTITRRWSDGNGQELVRLAWDQRPSFEEAPEILRISMAAQDLKLAVQDAKVLEITR
jgi:MarR-like DNA-binding transcriptional regulator SgrR of sgrS sRNA